MLDILIFLAQTADRKITAGYNADAHVRQLIIENADEIRHDVFRDNDPITFVDTGGESKPMQCVFVIWHGMLVACRISSLKCTVLSVCEGEWFGATTGAAVLQALEPVLEFLNAESQKPNLIFCDNKASCMLSSSNHTTKRMKHVARRLSFLQDLATANEIRLVHIKTEANLADIGTKVLNVRTFHHLASFILRP